MINLEQRNIEKLREDRKKAGISEIVSGICPMCEVNLYGKECLPQFKRGNLIIYCEVIKCPYTRRHLPDQGTR